MDTASAGQQNLICPIILPCPFFRSLIHLITINSNRSWINVLRGLQICVRRSQTIRTTASMTVGFMLLPHGYSEVLSAWCMIGGGNFGQLILMPVLHATAARESVRLRTSVCGMGYPFMATIVFTACGALITAPRSLFIIWG